VELGLFLREESKFRVLENRVHPEENIWTQEGGIYSWEKMG
jgi:hypothetical protein